MAHMYGPGSPLRALKQRHVSSTSTGPPTYAKDDSQQRYPLFFPSFLFCVSPPPGGLSSYSRVGMYCALRKAGAKGICVCVWELGGGAAYIWRCVYKYECK